MPGPNKNLQGFGPAPTGAEDGAHAARPQTPGRTLPEGP